MKLTMLLAALLLMPLTVAPRAIAADRNDGQWKVVLSGALPEDQPLELFVEYAGGEVRRAFALSPTFNRAWHEVNVASLEISDRGATADVRVTIRSDGYVPADGEAVACRYHVRLRRTEEGTSGRFLGRYGQTPRRGQVTAERLEPSVASPPVRFRLEMENALQYPGASIRSRRAFLRFSVCPDGSIGGMIDPAGSIVDVSSAPHLTRTDIRYRNGTLRGTARVTVRTQGDPNQARHFIYGLDGQVIGRQVAGNFTTRTGGDSEAEQLETGWFTGEAVFGDAPPAGDSLPKLRIHNVLGPAKFVDLYLSTSDGEVAHGFGASPNFNNATHTLDASRLELTNGRLRGPIHITVLPDPWTPKDGEPIELNLRLDAAIRHAQVGGTAIGPDGQEYSLTGSMYPKELTAEPSGGVLKLENALTGGNKWQNRVFFGVDLQGEKITGGDASNNHTSLSGQVQGGTLTLAGENVRGQLRARIADSGGVDGGEYRFTLEGIRVGDWLIGDFVTHRDGKRIKSNQFWGRLR